MEKETIYYKTVKCSDGLPEKQDWYLTDMGRLQFTPINGKQGHIWRELDSSNVEFVCFPTIWFSPLPAKDAKPLEYFSNLGTIQKPIEGAKEFLQRKGLMLGDVKDYEARYRKQGVNDKGQRTACFPDLDLVDLLTEFASFRPQETVDFYNDGGDKCGGCHQYFCSKVNYCPNCGSKINWK